MQADRTKDRATPPASPAKGTPGVLDGSWWIRRLRIACRGRGFKIAGLALAGAILAAAIALGTCRPLYRSEAIVRVNPSSAVRRRSRTRSRSSPVAMRVKVTTSSRSRPTPSATRWFTNSAGRMRMIQILMLVPTSRN